MDRRRQYYNYAIQLTFGRRSLGQIARSSAECGCAHCLNMMRHSILFQRATDCRRFRSARARSYQSTVNQLLIRLDRAARSEANRKGFRLATRPFRVDPIER